MEKANLGYMVETHPVPVPAVAWVNGPLLGASYLLCWVKPHGTRTWDGHGLDRESPFYFQEGDVRQMIWTVAEILTYLSASFSLALRELIS